MKRKNKYSMNWYKKFLKMAYVTPLDRDAIAICDMVVRNLLELYRSKNLYNQTISLKPEVKKRNPLQKQQKEWISLAEEELSGVFVTIENVNGEKDFVVGGIFWDFDKSLQITLRPSNKFSDKSFERLYIELLEIIRHEIRHLYDYSRGKDTKSPQYDRQVDVIDNIRNASAYILSKVERTPYIEGMMLRAKKSHVPFSNLVAQTVFHVFAIYAGDYRNKSIPPSILSSIQQIENSTTQSIIQRALLRYPKLQ